MAEYKELVSEHLSHDVEGIRRRGTCSYVRWPATRVLHDVMSAGNSMVSIEGVTSVEGLARGSHFGAWNGTVELKNIFISNFTLSGVEDTLFDLSGTIAV